MKGVDWNQTVLQVGVFLPLFVLFLIVRFARHFLVFGRRPWNMLESISHVVFICKSLQNREELAQLDVAFAFDSRTHGNGIFRLKNVGIGRVIDNDDFVEVPPQQLQVFNKDALIESAVVSEEPSDSLVLRIHKVHQRFSIQRDAGSSHHHFEKLACSL